MRLKVIDGLRAVAVLGVLWAHIWMFNGTPSFILFNVDFAKLISFFGTGVDLFFVISGFCMYLMYYKKQDNITVVKYLKYLKKRWLRIAPAFYVAVIIYAFFSAEFNFWLIDWQYAGRLFLFVKNFFEESTQYAPHFWSIGTEWHFYMILPLLLLAIDRISFYKTIIFTIVLCIVVRGLFWMHNEDFFNIINYSIPNRLIEFMMGILAARFYVTDSKGWLFNSLRGLLLGVAIAFFGRLLMSSGLQDRTDLVGFISRVMNLPVLSLGFGLVLLNALNTKSLFRNILETRFMTSVGKYSYSMYLWHWLVAEWMTRSSLYFWNLNSFLQVNITFILSTVILYPLSMLSYRMLESFYFKKSKQPIPHLENYSLK